MADTIGALNRRIEIIRVYSVTNANGYPEEKTESLCKCWAAVGDGTYRVNEYFAAQTGHAVEVVNFTVRYEIAKKYDLRPGLFVLYGNVRHRILNLYDKSHARDFVKLNTKIEQGVSG